MSRTQTMRQTRPHSPAASLKVLAQFQNYTMPSTTRIFLHLLLLAISSTVCTWLLVTHPSSQDIFGSHHPKSFAAPVGKAPKRHAEIRGDETFSACLLVMDDNHWLIEWLAYHYHALPLRYLVIAVDPRSQTSTSHVLDRWRDKMTILEWQDHDYMAVTERKEAEGIVRSHSGNLTETLVKHRARQRIFYSKCMKKLKEEQRTWTLMTDTDEFLRINTEKLHEISMQQKKKHKIDNPLPTRIEEPASIRSLLIAELQRPESSWRQSPCVQIPRIRFGAVETVQEGPLPPYLNKLPPQILKHAPTFSTLRWRKHAGPDQYWANRESKVLIDVSQVPWRELPGSGGIESIYRPIKSLCSQQKLRVRSSESPLIINHYLGSLSQYEYRDDARATDLKFGRGRQQYSKQRRVDAEFNDEICPWVQGFVDTMGQEEASLLLDGVGVLESKNPTPINAFMPQYGSNERCAIVFFGLPRSFKGMVLPSLQKNLLATNARYNCDYFVHYYNRTEEPEGRANKGGTMNPMEILLLEDAVLATSNSTARKVHNHEPVVEFTSDTEGRFWGSRHKQIQKYRTAKGDDGMYRYFPWKAKSYKYPSSLDNIVRQWHSISAAWSLMEASAAKRGVQYTRVGMFRSDVLFVTPIDIYQTERDEYDSQNSQAMLAPFGAMPINDRMIYGPYEAIEIWATKRFDFIEKYVDTCEPGWAMHSEKFLNGTVMPAIRELGIGKFTEGIVLDFAEAWSNCDDWCQSGLDLPLLITCSSPSGSSQSRYLLSTYRADFTAVATDCHLGGVTRGLELDKMIGLVEGNIGRKCSSPEHVTRVHITLQCNQTRT